MKFQYAIAVCLILVLTSEVQAQKTVTDLGKLIFRTLQTKEVEKLEPVIPTAAQNIEMVRKMGVKKTENDYETLRKAYPEKVKNYKSEVQDVLVQGEKEGIKWAGIKFEHVETSHQKITLGEGGHKTVTLTNLTLFFTYKNKTFKVEQPQVFQLDNQYYLGGARINFEAL